MKNKFIIIILFIVDLGLHAQDNLNFFKFIPEISSINKPEMIISRISANEYESSKQQTIKIKAVDYKDYAKKSDSVKRIFEIKCPSIFLENGCIQLNMYDNTVNKFCVNRKPLDEKQYLDFHFIGIDNKLASIYVTPYEGVNFYVIDLKSKLCYLGCNYTNLSEDIIYGFYDYISYSFYIYDLKNKKDLTFVWGGPHDIIKDFYLHDDKCLRIKYSNDFFDNNYKYISIQFRK